MLSEYATHDPFAVSASALAAEAVRVDQLAPVAFEHQVDSARVQDAYQVLNYNQQLIQFADSKAGNLIVINSLFIAAAQAQGLQASAGLLYLAQAGYILLACTAVLYCLTVIMSKPENTPAGRKDLIFFSDIMFRKTPGHYSKEFRETNLPTHLDDILKRTHILASIAQRKFSSYATAQQITAYAAYLWVAANLLQFLK